MKRIIAVAAALFVCAALFARSIRKSPKADGAFNDINMVAFKAAQPEAEYELPMGAFEWDFRISR